MTPRGVLETCVYAQDLEAAERFYTEVLGLAVIARQPGRHVFFRCGHGVCLVFNPEQTAVPMVGEGGIVVPLHGAHGPGHLAFAVSEADLLAWRDRLRNAGVPLEAEITWPNGGRSLYLRDPAGNSIELATPRLWGLADADDPAAGG